MESHRTVDDAINALTAGDPVDYRLTALDDEMHHWIDDIAEPYHAGTEL